MLLIVASANKAYLCLADIYDDYVLAWEISLNVSKNLNIVWYTEKNGDIKHDYDLGAARHFVSHYVKRYTCIVAFSCVESSV